MSHTRQSVRPSLVVFDLDGTLLHDAPTFDQQSLSPFTGAVIHQLHAAGVATAISTARPPSNAACFAELLDVDVCIYLNGAFIDTSRYQHRESSAAVPPARWQPVTRFGIDSARACAICMRILKVIPGVNLGIVMNGERYTNFDVTSYWSNESCQPTDFSDVPSGTADKILIFPTPQQRAVLPELIPKDLAINVSEGVLWMIMNPLANKRHSLEVVCTSLGLDPRDVVAFGDDLIDLPMLTYSGTGVAVANAQPELLMAADEVCQSNNEDGVAHWLCDHVLNTTVA